MGSKKMVDKFFHTKRQIDEARKVSLQRCGVAIPGEQKALFALMAAAERILAEHLKDKI